jgi:UDP-glucose 4-epimerase
MSGKLKILVTGGAGFIGSHIVDAYIAAGYKVVVVDDLSNGKEEYVNRIVREKGQFYKVDITKKDELDTVFQDENIDIINHHAAQVDIQKGRENPTSEILINQIGAINLLNCAVENKIKKFIFASSAAVYGDEAVNSTENMICKPMSLYGFSKLSCEEYIKYYNRKHNLNFTILRYPNVYGPRHEAGEGGVIQIFFKKMIEKKPTVFFGNGNQTRDFIFVKDVAQANVEVLTKGDHTILNISTGKSMKIKEVHNRMKTITGYQDEARRENERPGDIIHSKLNPHQAEITLNWTYKTELGEGLKKTYQAIKK